MSIIKKNNISYCNKKNIFILLLIILTIYIIGSLISFNVNDPSWTTISTEKHIDNYFGITGAYISGLILSLFGVVGFLIPLFMIKIIKYLILKKERESFSYLKFAIKTIGLIGIILGICGISQLYLKTLTPHLPEYSGGIVGYEVIKYLYFKFTINMNISLLFITCCGLIFYFAGNVIELLRFIFISDNNNTNNISISFENFNKKKVTDKVNKKNNYVDLEKLSKKLTDDEIETINIK